MTAEAEQLGAGGLGSCCQTFPPGRTMVDDGRDVGQGLHVIDHGWLAPKTLDSREGRLGARIGPDSLQGIDQGCLFTADVTSG